MFPDKKPQRRNNMKKIGIMIGSDSDLPQCLAGLNYLKEAQKKGLCDVVIIITNSIHRNTEEVLENLRMYSHLLDAWIIGAGWANHLTGTCDAFLRYTLKNTATRVFGVAFRDDNNAGNNLAACLSITRVPGTQVIYNKKNIGETSFFDACLKATESDFADLPPIKIGAPKPAVKRTLEQAIEFAAKK